MKTEIRCRKCNLVFAAELVQVEFAGACPQCLAGFAFAEEGTAEMSDVPLPLQPGTAFRGLEVQDLLGQGGMGVVYRARQAALGRSVALKVLAPRFASDSEFAERFNREAKVLAALNHPNIVHIYEFGREANLYFLVMEYVDGVSLRDLLRDRRLGATEALGIVRQLCEALEYAHSQGVVHRDIKPENILLDQQGRVKIADFGLAKMSKEEARVTRTNVVMGTPAYMSPEQHEGAKDVDHRTDIYSLGVVFYEMLTGELPVGRFEVPSARVPLDARLDGVVLKALEKRPERRYQRASQMQTEIESFTNARGTTGPTPQRGLKLRPRPFGFGMLGFFYAVIFLAFLYQRDGESVTWIRWALGTPILVSVVLCVMYIALTVINRHHDPRRVRREIIFASLVPLSFFLMSVAVHPVRWIWWLGDPPQSKTLPLPREVSPPTQANDPRIGLVRLINECEAYHREHSVYPPAEWEQIRVLKDAWARPFVYRNHAATFPKSLFDRTAHNKKTFDLYSVGPNGFDEKGGGDDIGNW